MSQRNKNNSIIFLTTLSVYLGLVLVGAPPQILAQIEKSQNQIQSSNNSEFKRFAEYDYAESLIKFAENALYRISFEKRRNLSENFDERFYAKAITFAPYLHENGELSKIAFLYSGENVKFLSPGQHNILSVISRKLVEHFNDFSNQKESVFRNSIAVILDDYDYKCEIVIENSTSQGAVLLVSQLQGEISYLASSVKGTPAKQIYENTKVSSENNQVFIVTRLPRGSLDALLKQDAKADIQ